MPKSACARGRLDLLVNNAGAGISGAAEFTDPQAARAQFDVNFFGAAACCSAALPLLRKAKGRIVNISSVAAVYAIPFQAMYSASKSGAERIFQRAGPVRSRTSAFPSAP